MMKSPTSLITIRNAVGVMLAMSAIFAVVLTAVTITNDRAFAQDPPVEVTITGPATNPSENDAVCHYHRHVGNRTCRCCM